MEQSFKGQPACRMYEVMAITDDGEVENDLRWPWRRCQGQSAAYVQCRYNAGELRSDQC